jgi:hypothetical protein
MKQNSGKNFGQSWNLKKKRRTLFKGKRKKAPVLRKKNIVDQEIVQLQQKIDQGVS